MSIVFRLDQRLQRLTPCCTLLPYSAFMTYGLYRMVCDILQPRRGVNGPYCCTKLSAVGDKDWLTSRGSSFPILCRYKQCYVLPERYACQSRVCRVSNPRLVIAVAACCRTCGPSPDRWCERVRVRALLSIYYVQRNICKKVDRVQWNQLTCGELTCADVRVRTKPQFVVVARSSVSCRRFQGLELNVVMV